MPVLPVLATLAAVAGAVETGIALTNQPDKPNLPSLPNPDTAKENATDKVNSQRRLALLTGGLTDYTGGQAVLGNNDVNKTALLGN